MEEWISQEDCGSQLLPQVDLECETLRNGDLKIKVVGSKNRPKIYIGLHDMMEEAEKVLKYVMIKILLQLLDIMLNSYSLSLYALRNRAVTIITLFVVFAGM